MNLTAIIFQFICALACIGLGIYYCFTGDAAQIAIFFVVGGVCLINSVRMYIQYRKNNKDGEK